MPEHRPHRENAIAGIYEGQILMTKAKTALTTIKPASLAARRGAQALSVPRIITNEGEKTTKRFLEFFTANIRNLNTRRSYARAVEQFLTWCEERGASLEKIEPLIVAAYIEKLTKERSAQTVKQHLAAIRMLFDWLVIGQALPFNPAASVRGPRYSYKQGKTPMLPVDEMRGFLEQIDISTLIGLRDRALIGLMVYSFARVSAVVGMKIKDYYAKGKRHFIGLHEKGGKYHEVPVHHKAEDFLDAYLAAAGIAGEKNAPLFQTAGGKGRKLTGKPMSRFDAWAMVKRRAKEAGIDAEISPHSFRATGITAYLENGGTIEHAQQIAAHESPRTTKLYDRRNDQITLDEIERIAI
jgi:site-specific recombinase XerD